VDERRQFQGPFPQIGELSFFFLCVCLFYAIIDRDYRIGGRQPSMARTVLIEHLFAFARQRERGTSSKGIERLILVSNTAMSPVGEKRT
jgi:hypothetical protein